MNKTQSSSSANKEDYEEAGPNQENLLIEIESNSAAGSLSACLSAEDEIPNSDSNIVANEGNVQILVTSNYKYIGRVENGKRHGFGICEYTKGDKYIGEFFEGKKHGYGKFITKEGHIYQGEFKNGIVDGFLESILKSTIKQGYAKNYVYFDQVYTENTSKGSVVSTTENGNIFGTIEIPGSNYKYQGELSSKYAIEGYGILYVKDKYVYKGQLSNGSYSGYGEFYKPGGMKFFGFFNKNVRNGFGINYYKDGKIGFGRYVNDQKHGPFVYNIKNVNRIEMFNYGFKYKTIEKADSAKNYFKTYYPEFEWVFKLNFKNMVDLFIQVIAEEFVKVVEKKDNAVSETNTAKIETNSENKEKEVKIDNNANLSINGKENIEGERVEKQSKQDGKEDISEILN